MNPSHLRGLDLNIARARIILSVATLVSIYLDPNVPDMTPWIRLTGGPMRIDRYALATLCAHLAYSTVVHGVASFRPLGDRFATISTVVDVLFGVAIAVFTEGPTSPSFAFFAFAIIAAGCRLSFRATLGATFSCVVLYLSLILLSSEGETTSAYLMRPIYLAITGYLIGYLGEQRASFEARIKDLEARAERHEIARSLHDGYIQALAAVNLRLAACRQLLSGGQTARALAEIEELQTGVAREYDQVRAYVRSLVEIDGSANRPRERFDTSFQIDARFRASGLVAEQLLCILLEGVRNTIRHAHASSASLIARSFDGSVRISLEDDGIGFPHGTDAPWSITSRISELGGRVAIHEPGRAGARLEIELPAGMKS
jgi:signal transduction histidine kinase